MSLPVLSSSTTVLREGGGGWTKHARIWTVGKASSLDVRQGLSNPRLSYQLAPFWIVNSWRHDRSSPPPFFFFLRMVSCLIRAKFLR